MWFLDSRAFTSGTGAGPGESYCVWTPACKRAPLMPAGLPRRTVSAAGADGLRIRPQSRRLLLVRPRHGASVHQGASALDEDYGESTREPVLGPGVLALSPLESFAAVYEISRSER